MANYSDYQLDEMENAAVNKSKNLKRAGIIGAGVLGTAGAAFAASAAFGGDEDVPELTSDDLLAGAQAGVDEAAEEPEVQEIHVYEHEAPAAVVEPDVDIKESAVLFDEDGDVVATFDAGTVDGKDFVIIDSDLNGAGDIMAYDVNGNGIYETNEIAELDNQSYMIGQGRDFHMYADNGMGGFDRIDSVSPIVGNGYENEDYADIHNDFEDEKTGEFYHDDLADNNYDYNNNGGEEYSAEIDNDFADNIGDSFDSFDSYDSFDDGSMYTA